jgi:hypothetical protein
MILSVLVLAAVGVLNPSYRGGFMSFALFLFVFAGYGCIRDIISFLVCSLDILVAGFTSNSVAQNGK